MARKTRLPAAIPKRKTSLRRVEIVFESTDTRTGEVTEYTVWRLTHAQLDAIVAGEKPRP